MDGEFNASTLRDWKLEFTNDRLPAGCGFEDLARLAELAEDLFEKIGDETSAERIENLRDEAKSLETERDEAIKERDEAKAETRRLADLVMDKLGELRDEVREKHL